MSSSVWLLYVTIFCYGPSHICCIGVTCPLTRKLSASATLGLGWGDLLIFYCCFYWRFFKGFCCYFTETSAFFDSWSGLRGISNWGVKACDEAEDEGCYEFCSSRVDDPCGKHRQGGWVCQITELPGAPPPPAAADTLPTGVGWHSRHCWEPVQVHVRGARRGWGWGGAGVHGQMRVLWTHRGVHSRVRRAHERNLLRPSSVWALRGGCQGREAAYGTWDLHGRRCLCPHEDLPQLQLLHTARPRRALGSGYVSDFEEHWQWSASKAQGSAVVARWALS